MEYTWHYLFEIFVAERAARHHHLLDALYKAAASANLAPRKEDNALLPGTDARPADVFVPHWTGSNHFNQFLLSRLKVSENIKQIKVNLKQNINKIDTTELEAILRYDFNGKLISSFNNYSEHKMFLQELPNQTRFGRGG